MSTREESGDSPVEHRIVDAEPDPAAPMKPSGLLRRLGHRRALLITDATRTPEQNRRHREKVYILLQSSRIPLIGLAVGVFWLWHLWWLAIALLVIGIPIPWIAVVLANDKGEARDDRGANIYKPALARGAVTGSRRALSSSESGPGAVAHYQPPASAYGTGWGADTR